MQREVATERFPGMGTGLGKARSGVKRSPFHLVGEEPEPTKRFNWRKDSIFGIKQKSPVGVGSERSELRKTLRRGIIGEPLNQSSQLG